MKKGWQGFRSIRSSDLCSNFFALADSRDIDLARLLGTETRLLWSWRMRKGVSVSGTLPLKFTVNKWPVCSMQSFAWRSFLPNYYSPPQAFRWLFHRPLAQWPWRCFSRTCPNFSDLFRIAGKETCWSVARSRFTGYPPSIIFVAPARST